MNEMIDMSRFTEAKSDQLNADDLIGVSRTITITRVVGCEGDQPIAIYYDGDNGKPFKPCKTIRRVLLAIWGRYANDYAGKSMTVYRDDKVTFGGLDVGGIRISHMSGIEKDTVVVVAKSKGKKASMKIQPLMVDKRQSGLTIEQAAADLEAAATLDELRLTWTAKAMAPHRTELQPLLDRLKDKLSGFEPEGPSDEDRGETHRSAETLSEIDPATAKAEEIIERAAKVETIIDLNNLRDEAQIYMDAMTDEDMAGACAKALADAAKRLRSK